MPDIVFHQVNLCGPLPDIAFCIRAITRIEMQVRDLLGAVVRQPGFEPARRLVITDDAKIGDTPVLVETVGISSGTSRPGQARGPDTVIAVFSRIPGNLGSRLVKIGNP